MPILVYFLLGAGIVLALAFHLNWNFDGGSILGFSIPWIIYFAVVSPYLLIGLMVIQVFVAVATGFFYKTAKVHSFWAGAALGIIPFKGIYHLALAYLANTKQSREFGMSPSRISNSE